MIRERIEEELNNNDKLRRYIRKLANCTGMSYPINLVDGYSNPVTVGNRGYSYGHNIRSSWNYYRRPKYKPSTRRVEVGSDWVLEQLMTHSYLK